MQQYKKVIFTFDVPFKTISVDNANDLQMFFEQLYTSEFNKFDLNKLLNDYSQLTDIQKIDFNKNGIYSIVETTDTYHITVDFKRKFDDSFSFSDSITKKDSTKKLSESVSFTDAITKSLILKPFIDSVSYSDKIDKVFIKSLTDNISIAEILKKDMQSTLVSENIGMIDTMSISTQDYEECQVVLSEQFKTQWNKLITESFLVSDSYVKSTSKSLIDYISFLEQNLISVSKLTTDTVTVGNDSGVISINTYIDPIYFIENYIGTAQSF